MAITHVVWSWMANFNSIFRGLPASNTATAQSGPRNGQEYEFWECSDWQHHINRENFKRYCKLAMGLQKSDWIKIESLFLCPTFCVPRNIIQRRGNYYNPIFTLRIFSGVWHTNWGGQINARTGWKYSNMLKSVNPRPHFKYKRILMSLTRFD